MSAAFPIPQFTYGLNTFVPTYPATSKEPYPYFGQSAVRHDSTTTSGLRQSVLERIDRVTTLEFNAIPLSDIPSWDAFLTYALSGQQWEYAPDSTVLTTYTVFTLESMNVPIKRIGYQLYSLSLKVREVVTAEIGS